MLSCQGYREGLNRRRQLSQVHCGAQGPGGKVLISSEPLWTDPLVRLTEKVENRQVALGRIFNVPLPEDYPTSSKRMCGGGVWNRGC